MDEYMPKYQGFTLIELIVAVSILAIMITLGLPSFQNVISNNRRAAQVNEFLTSMTLARSEALKRGNPVGVCRASNYAATTPTCGTGSGWEDGWVVFEDRDAQGDIDTASDVLRVFEPLGGNITLRGESNVSSVILYMPSGRVGPVGGNNTVGTVVWCDDRGGGEDAREINITLSGHAESHHGDGGTTCTP